MLRARGRPSERWSGAVGQAQKATRGPGVTRDTFLLQNLLKCSPFSNFVGEKMSVKKSAARRQHQLYLHRQGLCVNQSGSKKSCKITLFSHLRT